MIELMANLKKLEGESQTAAKVIAVLIEGIKIFADICNKWKQLVAFFETIKTMIDIGMATPTEDLVKAGEKGLKRRQEGKDLTSLKTKTLSRVIISFKIL